VVVVSHGLALTAGRGLTTGGGFYAHPGSRGGAGGEVVGVRGYYSLRIGLKLKMMGKSGP
jgi:hypothetical protein